MAEPRSNIRGVCNEHRPRPRPDLYGSRDPASFVDKYVKLGFKTNIKQPDVEHMWVKVTGVKDGHLVGRLDNDPLYCSIKCGDPVHFSPGDIEQVLGEPDPRTL